MTPDETKKTIQGILVVLHAMLGELSACDSDTPANLDKLRNIVENKMNELNKGKTSMND